MSATASLPSLRARIFERLRFAWRALRGGDLSPLRASASVAVGLFIGSLPIYGLHFPLVLLICLPLRLDVVVAYLAANISNPLFAPFLLSLEVEVGSLLLTGEHVPFDVQRARETGVSGFVAQAAVGSLAVGATLAVFGAVAAWTIAAWRRDGDEVADAVDRTVARYRHARRADRFYVLSKLQSDPVVRGLAGIPGSFGRVVDLGGGRGQFGILLHELGRVDALWGVDWDERKVQAARLAARDDADYFQADVRDVELPEADTVLLIDVLHYLSVPEQDALLERAKRCLLPGGRIIVRDVDAGAGLRGWLTRIPERIGAAIGYNRAERLDFRSAQELVDKLREMGLECEVVSPARGGALANALMVARRP